MKFRPHLAALIFSLVWFVNGFFCKILNLVPRHLEIVERILGETYARELTLVIGLGECLFGLLVLSGWRWRYTASLQILAVLTMNVIEFVLARDLLLFGALNALIALVYCFLVGVSMIKYK
ncbi:MAG: DoxX-like family protein [Bacteroidota bacterium]